MKSINFQFLLSLTFPFLHFTCRLEIGQPENLVLIHQHKKTPHWLGSWKERKVITSYVERAMRFAIPLFTRFFLCLSRVPFNVVFRIIEDEFPRENVFLFFIKWKSWYNNKMKSESEALGKLSSLFENWESGSFPGESESLRPGKLKCTWIGNAKVILPYLTSRVTKAKW